MAEANTYYDLLKQEIEVIKNNSSRIEELIIKTTENSEQLKSLCNEITMMVKIQEGRLQLLERDHEKHKTKVEISANHINDAFAKVHSKIESTEQKSEEKIEKSFDKLLTKIEQIDEKFTVQFNSLNRFRTFVVGAVFAMGLLIGKSGLIVEFFKIFTN